MGLWDVLLELEWWACVEKEVHAFTTDDAPTWLGRFDIYGKNSRVRSGDISYACSCVDIEGRSFLLSTTDSNELLTVIRPCKIDNWSSEQARLLVLGDPTVLSGTPPNNLDIALIVSKRDVVSGWRVPDTRDIALNALTVESGLQWILQVSHNERLLCTEGHDFLTVLLGFEAPFDSLSTFGTGAWAKNSRERELLWLCFHIFYRFVCVRE